MRMRRWGNEDEEVGKMRMRRWGNEDEEVGK